MPCDLQYINNWGGIILCSAVVIPLQSKLKIGS